MPTTQATFYQWPDCWRRFLVLLIIDVIKPLPMFFWMLCWIQFEIQQSVLNFKNHAGYVLSMTRLLKTIFGLADYRRYKAATNVLLNALLDPVRDPAKCFKFFSDKHCMQVATSSTFPSANDVIELYCILYNKTSIIATSFSQRTTAFEIFFNRTYLHFRYLVLEKQKLKISVSLPDLFDS